MDTDKITNIGSIVSAVGGILATFGITQKNEILVTVIGLLVLTFGVSIIGYFSNKFKLKTDKVLDDVDSGLNVVSSVLTKIDPKLSKPFIDLDNLINELKKTIDYGQSKISEINSLVDQLSKLKSDHNNIVNSVNQLISEVKTIFDKPSEAPKPETPEQPK